MKVIVIDPGEKVGWATATIEDGKLTVLDHGIAKLKPFALKFDTAAKDYDLVIHETWRLATGLAQTFAGSDFPTVQLIGAIKLSCWRDGVRIIGQAPKLMKTGIKVADEDIKRRIDGLPKAHDESHDGSALLHLAYYHWKTT